MNKKFKKPVIVLIILLLAFSIYTFSYFFLNKERLKIKGPEHYLLIPSGKYLKLMSFGYEEILGDILLSRALIYYGSHYYRGNYTFPYLFGFFNGVTDLDSYNLQAYLMGARLLSNLEPKKSIDLLNKGMTFLPNNWKLPELAGFIYFYNIGDKKQAAKYYEIASKKPGHPPYVPSLSSKFYRESGELQNAIRVLYNFYSTAEDSRLKKVFKQDIDRLQAELKLRSKARKGKVVKIVDGDSLFIKDGDGRIQEARLIGINTFELNSKEEEKRIYGWMAKDFAYYELHGKNIFYTIGGDKVDKHGRVLIYLWYKKNKMYNLEIIKKGFAKAFLRYDFKNFLMEKFAHEEKLSKRNSRGIWKIKKKKPIRKLNLLNLYVGKAARVQYEVYNVYKGNDYIYINSSSDFKNTFNAVVPKWAAKNFSYSLLNLQKKEIIVYGFVSEYKQNPEIKVYEEEQIKIIE